MNNFFVGLINENIFSHTVASIHGLYEIRQYYMRESLKYFEGCRVDYLIISVVIFRLGGKLELKSRVY